jgi:hypothetical protein
MVMDVLLETLTEEWQNLVRSDVSNNVAVGGDSAIDVRLNAS